MGAFFLNRDSNVDVQRKDAIFSKLGFRAKKSFKLGIYQLDLYEKQLLQLENFIESDVSSIFVCGSIVYKGLGYRESLRALLEDYDNRQINHRLLYGNYVIFFYNNATNQLGLLIDPLFIKNCYFDADNGLISSHFLAIVQSSTHERSINRLAIIESIVTGNLIPPDTYLNGIQKCCAVNYSFISQTFKNIECIQNRYTIDCSVNSFGSAVIDANIRLKDYFDAQVNLTKQFGAHIGLTGGFDSRLLLLQASNKLENLTTNSFFRENSKEFIIAKRLASEVSIDFRSFEENKPAELLKTVDSELVFLFLDGQIRSENYVDEVFNLPTYSELLYKGSGIGYHGCGGEQYRNADRFSGKQNFRDWVENEWVFRLGRSVFTSKKMEENLIDSVSHKIRRILDYDDKYVDLHIIKRVQNEIWNQSNRTTRVNALNQQLFYFAPFTEYQLSISSYSYIPYLGRYAEFQIAMMRQFQSSLNDINLSYGFSISNGPSLKTNFVSYLAHLVPRKILIDLHRKIRANNSLNINNSLEYEDIRQFTEGVNLSTLLNSNYGGKTLLALKELVRTLNKT